jgi:hypothetical protein
MRKAGWFILFVLLLVLVFPSVAASERRYIVELEEV